MSAAAGKLLLRAAIQGDRHQCQSLILEGGANPNVQNEGGETPLHVACEVGGRTAVIELLLGLDADPNARTIPYTGHYTALHVAVKKQRYREAQLLLDGGADANLADSKGRLPLHYAAEKGDLEMCRLLVLGGNSVYKVTDGLGATPSALARSTGNFPEVAAWLENPRGLEASDLPPLRTEESAAIVSTINTVGLGARLK